MAKWKKLQFLNRLHVGESIKKAFARYTCVVYDYAWMFIILSTVVALTLAVGFLYRKVAFGGVDQYTTGKGRSIEEIALYRALFRCGVRKEMFIIENPNGENILTKSFLDELWRFHLGFVNLRVNDPTQSDAATLQGLIDREVLTQSEIDSIKASGYNSHPNDSWGFEEQSTSSGILHNTRRLFKSDVLNGLLPSKRFFQGSKESLPTTLSQSVKQIVLPNIKKGCDVTKASIAEQISGLACLEPLPAGARGFQNMCATNAQGECAPPKGVLFMYDSRNMYGSPLGFPFHIRQQLPQRFATDMWISPRGAQIDRSLGIIQSASAFMISYEIERCGTTSALRKLWEQRVAEYVQQANKNQINGNHIRFLTSYSLEMELASSTRLGSNENIILLCSMLILLIVYVSAVNVSFKAYRINVWPALMGLIASAYGFIGGVGFCYLIGVEHTGTVTAVPFLVLSIGLDDMFVILNAYYVSPKDLSARSRVSHALKECGISITITTTTNLIVFIIGTSSLLPAIRNFCICTAVSLFLGYIMMLTYFLGWLCIAARREELRLVCYCGLEFCRFPNWCLTRKGKVQPEIVIHKDHGDRWEVYFHSQLISPSSTVDVSILYDTGDVPYSSDKEKQIMQMVLQYAERIIYSQSQLLEALQYLDGLNEQKLLPERAAYRRKADRLQAKRQRDKVKAEAIITEAKLIEQNQQQLEGRPFQQIKTHSIIADSQEALVPGSAAVAAWKPELQPRAKKRSKLCEICLGYWRLFTHLFTSKQKRPQNHPMEEFYNCNLAVKSLKADAKSTIGSFTRLFFADYYGRFITLPLVEFVILLLFCIYLGFAIYGCTKLRTGLDIRLLASEGSSADLYFKASQKYFSKFGTPVNIFFPKRLDWCALEVEREIQSLQNFLLSREYTVALISGYDSIPKSMNTSFVGLNLKDCSLRYQLAVDADAGGTFLNDFVFKDGLLQSFRMLLFPPAYNVTSQNGLFMDNVRKDLSRFPSLSPQVYFNLFSFYEADQNVVLWTLLNMMYGTIAVFLVSLLLLPSLWIGILVILTLVMIDTGIIGFLYYWDLNLSSLTMINLIIAVGFSVDYSLHICHGFGHSNCITRKLRVIETLSVMGIAIFHGLVSSLCGVAPLGFSHSFILRVFFKATVLVLVLGGIHGLIFLPVVLCLVGPMVKRGALRKLPQLQYSTVASNKSLQSSERRHRLIKQKCISNSYPPKYLVNHGFCICNSNRCELSINMQPYFNRERIFDSSVRHRKRRIHYFVDATEAHKFFDYTQQDEWLISSCKSNTHAEEGAHTNMQLLYSLFWWCSSHPEGADSTLCFPFKLKRGLACLHPEPIKIYQAFQKCVSYRKVETADTKLILVKANVCPTVKDESSGVTCKNVLLFTDSLFLTV